MIFMCIILDIRIPFFFNPFKTFFWPLVMSVGVIQPTPHTFATSWMCWEWLLPGGMKIRSSQPEFFSLVCIRPKGLSTTTSILFSLDKNIKTRYLHLLQNVFQTSYLFEQVHSNSEYNYKSLKHEWENFIALSFCWFFFFFIGIELSRFVIYQLHQLLNV